MEKKIYQTPNTELLHINVMSHLLDWSAPRDEGYDGEEAEARRNLLCDDDLDFFEDEEIEPCWSFNVWE